ncbi:GNAT family N-acetyltransferase [Nocardioides xinjiangensis]|uniref:GNAT family N-acetyltransferase n=1 Tax=Nocardioides xinjiangensis TaxID=2817376 RepID=UPI001B30D361|nr:GNAT family N-acetyltransferase [Nocardioides sp. SYSU D00778]
MLTAADVYPPFGLRVVAGPLELRGLTDELLLELCAVAEAGIHDPDEMPFHVPWSTAPAGQLSRNTAAYHWGKRATFSPDDFCLDLAVLLDGRVIGAQGVAARDFPVTRTGETGSWLGREHQGRGLGTAVRRAFCELLFDHLGFEEITSAAFLDNPASLAVSRKVGYRPTAVTRRRREGELALNQGLVLTPETFVRGEVPVEVTGAGAVRSFFGLAPA